MGIAVTLFSILYFGKKSVFVVFESKLGFDETVDFISQKFFSAKWNIPQVYDLQSTMSKNGFGVKPVKVFSVCKPDHAFQILGSVDFRHISSVMPCRLSVYEKEGKTFISLLNLSLLSVFMSAGKGRVMKTVHSEMISLMDEIIS